LPAPVLRFLEKPEQRDWEFLKILNSGIKVFRKFSADRANIFVNSQTVIGNFPENMQECVEAAFNLCVGVGPINFGNDRFDRFFANRQVGGDLFFLRSGRSMASVLELSLCNRKFFPKTVRRAPGSFFL